MRCITNKKPKNLITDLIRALDNLKIFSRPVKIYKYFLILKKIILDF